MLHYCKKCGRIRHESYIHKEQICDCCKSTMHPVPKRYLWDGFDENFKDDKSEQFLIDELIKTSPEFDQYLFDHRDEILAKQSAEFNAAMAHGKAALEGKDKGNKFGVSCPYCHATNVKKITMTSRVISTGLFGLGSKHIGKQWHCNHCGSDF